MATRTSSANTEAETETTTVESPYLVVSTWMGALILTSADGTFDLRIEPGDNQIEYSLMQSYKTHPAIPVLQNMGVLTITPDLV